jgi:hypothetical protein
MVSAGAVGHSPRCHGQFEQQQEERKMPCLDYCGARGALLVFAAVLFF